MKRNVCILICSIHLLTLAVCTCLAAINIYSILVTGWVCSATGVACGIAGVKMKRPEIAFSGFLTIFVAVTLFALEALVLNLGPQRALVPFCIVFFIHNLIATFSTLVGLKLLVAPADSLKLQVSLRSLFVSITTFAIFLAIAKQFFLWNREWLSAIAVGLFGVTVIGLTVTLCSILLEDKRTHDEKHLPH